MFRTTVYAGARASANASGMEEDGMLVPPYEGVHSGWGAERLLGGMLSRITLVMKQELFKVRVYNV